MQPGYKLAEHEEETGSGGFALPVRTFWNVFWRRRIGECAYERAGRTGKAQPEAAGVPVPQNKILNCEYRPNEFLNEQKLCAEMGNISRTPMRDALGRLEQEGLITILPKKGLMVSGITEEDVHSMFEMRLLVEPYALRTYGNAIPREQLEAYAELMHHSERIEDFCESDDDFHELLMSTLPNKYLRSAYDRITGLNTRFRIMTGKVSMINQEQTCEEHLQILDAALAGDWDGAAMALQHHLELARDKAEGVIKVIRLW